ncbi:GNAT family N-acetyltransferase [Pseudomonas sp. MAFF 730085]|uniref:GNAT family N-acetyltransferase n=1 Tax=Pseudomonas kitaguniensis TaxID=2607908 RepID=A0A5N7JVW6_9PSED|nr:GNAT family protein [Pseudomonas kitaguniensis]MPQ85456.1 GNAT family N-acetyltransferase [Pseudomonas kitaguniensis]
MSEEFPEFSLERIKLRKIRPRDIGSVYMGLSDPRVVAQYGVSYKSLAATDEQMRWFEQIICQKTGIWWAIALNTDDSMIGACGLNDWCHKHRKAEVGYWLMPEHWRKGLLTEALPAVIRYGLCDMGLHRIHADVEPDNEPSCALLTKFGFHLEGTLRDVELKDGRFLSLHQYSLLSSDAAALRFLN